LIRLSQSGFALNILLSVAVTMSLVSFLSAQDTDFSPKWEQIPGPNCATPPEWDARSAPATCDNEEIQQWLNDILHWRAERRARVGYDDAQYKRPELTWTQSSFVQPQMMIHDRYFYHPVKGAYTVGRYPEDDHSFLKDWTGNQFPAVWDQKPVTWVSLDDARAYAQWAGKRLPHEWEWQFAAQGLDGRTYPWGNSWSADAVPVPDKGRDMAPASGVTAHPQGASPFGVMDMVGNVWQWTDEYMDDHTRAGVLRGGSHSQPQGSKWYFPQAYKLSQHGRYLLMAPSMDRSGAIGFRCVVDGRG
jgi:formylglycine-generating enzyme required for sulfatase activity